MIRTLAAVAALVVAVPVTACTNGESDAPAAPVTRPSCIVAQPPAWTAAIAGSGVNTGGVSTTARAVAPGGEVLAVRDNGSTRDLILIGTDKSVRDIYAVPDPDTFDIGYAAIDDRWIVFALDRIPRASNGVLPTIKRIEIMDRADGSIRTVAAQSAADGAAVPERNALDSVALHDGKVFWLTLDTYASERGTVRSFDPVTGVTTEVESGPGVDLVTLPGQLPEPLADIDAADRASLGTDGTAFGWIVDVERGGTGVGYWSPDSGVVTVTGLDLKTDGVVPDLFVYGRFVLLDKGFGGDSDNYAIVVDSRTGAVTGLERRRDVQYDRVVDAHDGVLALNLWSGPGKGDYRVGVLTRDALSPLTC